MSSVSFALDVAIVVRHVTHWRVDQDPDPDVGHATLSVWFVGSDVPVPVATGTREMVDMAAHRLRLAVARQCPTLAWGDGVVRGHDIVRAEYEAGTISLVLRNGETLTQTFDSLAFDPMWRQVCDLMERP